MDEENVFPVPNLKLQQHLFVLLRESNEGANTPDKQKARQEAATELLKGIEADGEKKSQSPTMGLDPSGRC